MNATLFDGGKVHRLNGAAAQCGVGKRHPRGSWQMELGEVSCQRCAKAALADASGQPTTEHQPTAAHAIEPSAQI